MKYDLNEILKLEMSKKKFPALTKNNAKLINFAIENDSKYRKYIDKNSEKSIKYLVDKLKEKQTEEILGEIIVAIDKQNSTHLSSYTDSDNKNARDKMKNEIFDKYMKNEHKFNEFKERLKAGDTDLVEEIATLFCEKYYLLSFASKFCTYMFMYMFSGYEDNKYSIYDSVLRKILPYYYYEHVKNELYISYDSKSKELKIYKKGGKIEIGYRAYCNIINSILYEVNRNKKGEEKVLKKDLDSLLWYYYKGEKDDADIGFESRITEALNTIPNYDVDKLKKSCSIN